MYNKKIRNNIYVSTIILFLLGTCFHFAYEVLGRNFIVGLLTPVNESVFEHLKLALLPIAIWWTLFYLIKGRKYSIDKSSWFLGCLVSIIVSILIIASIHYITVCGIGIESSLVNILSLYVAVFISQLIAYHLYKGSKGINYLISILLILTLLAAFSFLTINPPKIPLFEDPKSQTYGINSQK